MTDLTRYLELADRLESRFAPGKRVVISPDSTQRLIDDNLKSASAIRSLVERVRGAEKALKPFAKAYGTVGEHIPDDWDLRSLDARLKIKVSDLWRAHAALAQGKPGEADELPTPSGHAES